MTRIANSASKEELSPIEYVGLEILQEDACNPRSHSARNIDAIKQSLTTFGQQKPIVVDADNRVIAGNGTLQAARELGWSQLAIVRTALSGSAARAFAIADNRTAELAAWDLPNLGEILGSLRDQYNNADDDVDDPTLVDPASTGFNHDEIAGLLASTVDDVESPVDRIGEEWLIVITCDDEAHQRALLERLTKEGVQCRAVM